MYGMAGWTHTAGVRGLKGFESLCDSYTKQARANKPTKGNPRTQTRQSISKERAQQARANRQEQ